MKTIAMAAIGIILAIAGMTQCRRLSLDAARRAGQAALNQMLADPVTRERLGVPALDPEVFRLINVDWHGNHTEVVFRAPEFGDVRADVVAELGPFVVPMSIRASDYRRVSFYVTTNERRARFAPPGSKPERQPEGARP